MSLFVDLLFFKLIYYVFLFFPLIYPYHFLCHLVVAFMKGAIFRSLLVFPEPFPSRCCLRGRALTGEATPGAASAWMGGALGAISCLKMSRVMAAIGH